MASKQLKVRLPEHEQTPTTVMYASDYDEYEGGVTPLSDNNSWVSPTSLSENGSYSLQNHANHRGSNFVNNLAPVPERHNGRLTSDSFIPNESLNSISADVLDEVKRDRDESESPPLTKQHLNRIMIERVSTGGTVADKQLLMSQSQAPHKVTIHNNHNNHNNQNNHGMRKNLYPYYKMNHISWLIPEYDRYFEISQINDENDIKMQNVNCQIKSSDSGAYSIIANMPIQTGLFQMKIQINEIFNSNNPLIGIGIVSNKHDMLNKYLSYKCMEWKQNGRTLSQFTNGNSNNNNNNNKHMSKIQNIDFTEKLSNLIVGHDAESIGIFFGNQLWHNNENIKTMPFARKFSPNDIITLMIDATNKKLSFKINDKNLGVVWDNLDTLCQRSSRPSSVASSNSGAFFSSNDNNKQLMECFYPIITLGQKNTVTILEASMVNKPIPLTYEQEQKCEAVKAKWCKNKNFQFTYMKSNSQSKLKCKSTEKQKCAIFNYVMESNCDRIYRYRFELSSMKERDAELPKIGFGLVSKKLIDYSKREAKEYPTWIDVTNRFNVYWIYGTSLVYNTKLSKKVFGQNTGQLFHSGDIVEMIVDFTKETSHKVKFRYNDSFVATAFDEIDVLLSRTDVDSDCKDGYLRPTLNDNNNSNNNGNNNNNDEKQFELSPDNFDGCQCSIIMGTRGNAINLKSVTCEYTIKQLNEIQIPSAMSPTIISSDELFTLAIESILDNISNTQLAMGMLATLTNSDNNRNNNIKNGNNKNRGNRHEMLHSGGSKTNKKKNKYSEKNDKNEKNENIYNRQKSRSRTNSKTTSPHSGTLNVILQNEETDATRAQVVTSPHLDNGASHPIGVSMSDILPGMDRTNGTISIDSPSFRNTQNNHNSRLNSGKSYKFNENGDSRKGSVSVKGQIREFNNNDNNDNNDNMDNGDNKLTMDIITDASNSDNNYISNLKPSNFESIIMAYQGNAQILQTMNVQDLFVLETQLSNAIKNVRKMISVKNEQKFLCNICMTNEKQQCIDPCGHVTCTQCVDNSMEKCPICQTNINSVIFLSM